MRYISRAWTNGWANINFREATIWRARLVMHLKPATLAHSRLWHHVSRVLTALAFYSKFRPLLIKCSHLLCVGNRDVTSIKTRLKSGGSENSSAMNSGPGRASEICFHFHRWPVANFVPAHARPATKRPSTPTRRTQIYAFLAPQVRDQSREKKLCIVNSFVCAEIGLFRKSKFFTEDGRGRKVWNLWHLWFADFFRSGVDEKFSFEGFEYLLNWKKLFLN